MNEIKDLIAKYEYGKYHLLDRQIKASFNRYQDMLWLDPFYDYESSSTIGECTELMTKLFPELRQRYPDMHITPTNGHDTNFFYTDSSCHWFLLMSEDSLFGDEKVLFTKRDLKRVQDMDPLVIDPSFQHVEKLSRSDYSLAQLFNPQCDLQWTSSAEMDHGDAIPLGMGADQHLIHLRADLRSNIPLQFGVQKAGGKVDYCSLMSDVIFDFIGADKRLEQLINYFRDMPFEAVKTTDVQPHFRYYLKA